MGKICRFILAALTVAACSKSDSSGSASGRETPVTAADLERLAGAYGSGDNNLTLNDDHTYSATSMQAITFGIGNRIAPALRFFPLCGTEEDGTYPIFKKEDRWFIRFSPSAVSTLQALLSGHGDDQYSPVQICKLFVKARKASYVQEFDIAGEGAIALHEWGLDIDYYGYPARIETIYETPVPGRLFLSLLHRAVDVTEYIGRYLEATVTPDHLKANGKFAPEETAFDIKQRKFSYINNQCGFALDFYKTKIEAIDGDFRIDRTGMALIRPLTSVPASFFRLRESVEQTTDCEKVSKFMMDTALVQEGFWFHMLNATDANLTFGDRKLELYLEKPPQ